MIARSFCFLTAALTLVLGLSVRPSKARPVTPDETRTYSMIGAMNVCVLDTLGVDFDKALLSSSVAIARIIEDKHNSQFEGFKGSGDLWSSEEDIRQAVAVQVSMLVDYLCQKNLNAENQTKLNRVLEASKKLNNHNSLLQK